MAAAMEEPLKAIQQLLQDATAYRDMSYALNLRDKPALSGISHVDYPLLTVPVVSAVHTVPLPLELLDHFDPMQNPHWVMGLFPEISHAWLIIDSDLFLWNFHNGQNVIRFDSLRDNILCAGLVKPKEGLLHPQISYLLVIATPARVVMLGVSVTRLQTGNVQDNASEEIQLLTEPLYSVAAQDTYISVTGTHNGRIFLSGKYGCLYEVVYKAKAGWLSPNCWIMNRSKSAASVPLTSMLLFKDDPIVQIAVDNSRNFLYTRSENCVLQVYDLGQDGNGISKVASVSQDTIVSRALDIAETVDPSVFKPIVQIAVIEKSESVNWHLVAITHAGARLYFTTSTLGQPTAQPCQLSLVHVRMPPGFTASASVGKPSKVHKLLYSNGVSLMAATKDEAHDLIWCINHDPIPFQKSLMETHAIVCVDGHSCALASLTDSSLRREQHMGPAKGFVVLTAHGSHIFYTVTPVDQLRHLLIRTYEGIEEHNIKQFFQLFHQDQACAASLQLACSTAASDLKLSAWATRAFCRYGGTAQVKMNPIMSAPNNITTNSSCLPSRKQHCNLPKNIFSARHNGIYIYFTCIINSIWDKQVTVERKFKTENCDFTAIDSSVCGQVLGSVLQKLRGLQDFLDRNLDFGTGSLKDIRYQYESMIPRSNRVNTGTRRKLKKSSGTTCNIQKHDVNIHHHQELHSKYHSEAQLAEKTSLQGIHRLVSESYQTLALWRLLCGRHFHQVVSELHMDLQEQLKKTTFKDLVTRDKELIRALIASLIGCHIRQNVEVDYVLSYLPQVCPLYYSTEDAIFLKANKYLQLSLEVQNKYKKEQMLRVSLQGFQKVCHLVDLDNVCDQYRQEHFYEGVVVLCLTFAEKKDPRGLGLAFIKNGEPKGDMSGLRASEEKMYSYKIIINLLQELVNQMKSSAPRVPTKPGASLQQRCVSNDHSGLHFEQLLKLAERSSDEFFHIVIFNWLIQLGSTNILLELKSPFLESHLVRITNRIGNLVQYKNVLSCYYQKKGNHISAAGELAKLAGNSSNHNENLVQYMNLLWRYYQKKGNHISAARVMAKLAGNSSIALKARIEYLSRAIVSARTSNGMCVPAEDTEFIHELEDTMDVAKVQLEIRATLIAKSSCDSSLHNAVAQLDSQLFGLTDLYEKFAEPFQLSECKLAILKCACFSNVLLVQRIWKEIIQRQLKDTIKMDAADRMQLLNWKLISLGKIYTSTPMYFPLQFLVEYLEQQVCTLDWDVGFVSKTMTEINVPVPRLFAVYDHLFRHRQPYWNKKKRPLHLLQCIHGLLSGYINNLSTVPSMEQWHFRTTCLNAISYYVAELQSMDPTPAVKTFIWTLKHLKTGLEQAILEHVCSSSSAHNLI